MDLFNLHADGVIRDLFQQQTVTAQMVKSRPSFDPLRQQRGFTLPKNGGFSLPKHGPGLKSGGFAQISRNVREEVDDMDKPPQKVVQNQQSGFDDDMGGPVTVQGTLAPVGKGTLQGTVVGGAAETKQPEAASAQGVVSTQTIAGLPTVYKAGATRGMVYVDITDGTSIGTQKAQLQAKIKQSSGYSKPASGIAVPTGWKENEVRTIRGRKYARIASSNVSAAGIMDMGPMVRQTPPKAQPPSTPRNQGSMPAARRTPGLEEAM